MAPTRTPAAPHPDTGRDDPVRHDPEWRARLEEIELELGYSICGARCTTTGLPCMRRPPRDEHRCLLHAGPTTPENNPLKTFQDQFPYSPNTKWGMNLNTFTVCRLCKVEFCDYRVCGERETIGPEVDDSCHVEHSIYNDVMSMAKEYGLTDKLQDSMLESVAFAFIHRYRAERAIAQEGMVLDSVCGFTRDGRPLYERKQHPLLTHINKLNDTIIKFSEALEFSPRAITRKKGEQDDRARDTSLVSALIQAARKDRSAGSDPLTKE